MAYQFKLADLANMTAAETRVVLAEAERGLQAPRNGQRAVLNARIRELELRYEMSSERMCARLGRGEILETAEIAHWLYLIDARDNRVRE